MLTRLGRCASPISRSLRASVHAIAGGAALDSWIRQKKEITLLETLHTDRLADLYITLPTRDGTKRPYASPKDSEALGFGHHLAFFHPRTPERYLRPDGTETDFCPPEPFVWRMWAGGRIEWRKPLIIGGKACARASVSSKSRTRVRVNVPFWKKGRMRTSLWEHTEERLEKFTPSPTTLFRFSALTFNGHRIHLDRDYVRELEGYHGITIPCDVQAMFVRSQDIPEITERPVYYHHPEVQMKTFEYRALNPVIVYRELTFHGSMSGSNEIVLWVLDEAGVLVGMKGLVSL